jgi:hypothetical protein
VRHRERLTPYVLLGVLILGTGMGIGLGLSEAPVIHLAGRTKVIDVPDETGSLPTAPAMGAHQCFASSLVLVTSPPNAADEPPQLSEGGFTLTNQSLAACELSTTPIFELVGSTGIVIASSETSNKAVNDVIQPGEAQGANLNWENWCQPADPRPLTFRVILPNGGGSVSSPYGDASTMLPTCTDSSLPTSFIPHGGGGPGTLFGG